MNEKEIEVAIMVSRGISGKPKYTREENWANPVAYLKDKEIFGEYLACSNDEGIDYLYQDQLQKIDGSFLNTLKGYCCRKEKHNIGDYIKTKKERLAKKHKMNLEFADTIKNYGKINARFYRGLRKAD